MIRHQTQATCHLNTADAWAAGEENLSGAWPTVWHHDLDVPASKAAPLALVISELFSNALRHGFPEGRSGHISVSITRTNGEFRIEIADDGVGMPEGARTSGFGLTIVQLLCQQLKARSETTAAGPGTRVVVNLPVNGAHH